MIRLHPETIKEPYWSAGSKYNWPGSRTGFGINVKHFEGMDDSDELEVRVIISNQTKVFRISKGKAKEISKKYNSIKKVGNGTILVILPKDSFTEVGATVLPPAQKVEEVDNRQEALFEIPKRILEK